MEKALQADLKAEIREMKQNSNCTPIVVEMAKGTQLAKIEKQIPFDLGTDNDNPSQQMIHKELERMPQKMGGSDESNEELIDIKG